MSERRPQARELSHGGVRPQRKQLEKFNGPDDFKANNYLAQALYLVSDLFAAEFGVLVAEVLKPKGHVGGHVEPRCFTS